MVFVTFFFYITLLFIFHFIYDQINVEQCFCLQFYSINHKVQFQYINKKFCIHCIDWNSLLGRKLQQRDLLDDA